jgi:hypothetical protein
LSDLYPNVLNEYNEERSITGSFKVSAGFRIKQAGIFNQEEEEKSTENMALVERDPSKKKQLNFDEEDEVETPEMI